jgi:hypothetical protein
MEQFNCFIACVQGYFKLHLSLKMERGIFIHLECMLCVELVLDRLLEVRGKVHG